MKLGQLLLLVAILPLATSASAQISEEKKDALRSALTTVEGTVISIKGQEEAQDSPAAPVRIRLDIADQPEVDILLAPQQALAQAGFHVEAGDLLRARVFVSEDGPVQVHKVFNVTRNTELRIRTLMRIPLWDSDGNWQGGPGRHRGEHPH